jgi:MoaA/NifB/PqqE/SkfB family radical SAM enzyme
VKNCFKGLRAIKNNIAEDGRFFRVDGEPLMVDVIEALVRYLRGFRRTAVFAVTTECNCRCVMCDVYKKPPRFVSVKDAMKVLDFLSQNNFLIVYFTGGEPTLHPNIVDMVRYANRLGLVTAMTTNGTASRDMIMGLKESGLFLLSVSLDHWDGGLCEKIRRHKDIKTKQEETIESCKEAGLRIYTLTFLNSYILRDGVERMVRYVNQRLGVPFGFCYPVKSDASIYPLGENLSEEDISFPSLRRSVETLLSLKRRGGVIANLGTCIEDIIRFHEKKPPNFYCKGGEDVIYVDWSGNVYPCFMKKKLFNVLNGKEPRFLKNVMCDECLTNCFREPSVLAQSSNPLLIKEILYSYPTRNLFI